MPRRGLDKRIAGKKLVEYPGESKRGLTFVAGK